MVVATAAVVLMTSLPMEHSASRDGGAPFIEHVEGRCSPPFPVLGTPARSPAGSLAPLRHKRLVRLHGWLVLTP